MAEKKTATPTSSGTSTALAVGGVALAGVALYLATKNKTTPPPSGPTAKFTPNSGEVTNTIVVTGDGWSVGETISSVTIGDVAAANTLIVDDTGALVGSLTVPGLQNGSWNVIITGSVTGAVTFPGAFTVKPTGGQGWVVLAGFTTSASPVAGNPVGWVALNQETPFMVTVTATTANPVGWFQITQNPFTFNVIHTQANPVGWFSISDGFIATVNPQSVNPVGWVTIAHLAVHVSLYTGNLPAQLNISPTTLHTGDTLSFTFYNMTPMSSVAVQVLGGGGMNVTANALGSGSSSFSIGEGTGFYTLQASDPYGKTASANFTVVGTGNSPQFPAPGTVGDGNYWYWVQYTDNSIGWDDAYDVVVYHDPLVARTLAGPYPSGATG
jgi:hypothetical protein